MKAAKQRCTLEEWEFFMVRFGWPLVASLAKLLSYQQDKNTA
jgi:hypothetical protein